jgi:hypothetical protein
LIGGRAGRVDRRDIDLPEDAQARRLTLLGGPVAYAAVTEFVLTAAWCTPWFWPARPPHDTGAALCTALVLVIGVVLLAVRGPRDSSKE